MTMNMIPKTYAFIDSQNLEVGIKGLGWSLDSNKFYRYLRDKLKVEKVFLFLEYLPTNTKLYNRLTNIGYQIIFKPTTKLPNGTFKGNVDAELVLHSMIEFETYNKAIIVSGDGDFHCLIGYLVKKEKLSYLIIPNQYKYSFLLKKFSKDIILLNDFAENW
jgi:uncharacterized LabA/DUF88 family protein